MSHLFEKRIEVIPQREIEREALIAVRCDHCGITEPMDRDREFIRIAVWTAEDIKSMDDLEIHVCGTCSKALRAWFPFAKWPESGR